MLTYDTTNIDEAVIEQFAANCLTSPTLVAPDLYGLDQFHTAGVAPIFGLNA
jgi:hypothetical protein